MADIPRYVPPDVKQKAIQAARAGTAFILLIGSQAACSINPNQAEQQAQASAVEVATFSLIEAKDLPPPFDAQELVDGLFDGRVMIDYFQRGDPSSNGDTQIITTLDLESGAVAKKAREAWGDAKVRQPKWASERLAKNDVITVITQLRRPLRTSAYEQPMWVTALVAIGASSFLSAIPDQTKPSNKTALFEALSQGLAQIRTYSTSPKGTNNL